MRRLKIVVIEQAETPSWSVDRGIRYELESLG